MRGVYGMKVGPSTYTDDTAVEEPTMLSDALIAQLAQALRTHGNGTPLRSRETTPRRHHEERASRTPTPRAFVPEAEKLFPGQFLANFSLPPAATPEEGATQAGLSRPDPVARASTPLAHASRTRPREEDALERYPKRHRHVVSEQRRRNQIREEFTALSELLDLGRSYGARGLGLYAGAGTGVEDEVIDDRSDTEEDLSLVCDEEEARRRRRNAQRRARTRAKPANQAHGRGRGRGRGGSAGRAGSKSAVLFQVVDLLTWLEERQKALHQDIAVLESIAAVLH